MIKPIVFAQKNGANIIPALFCAFGFIFGVLIFAFFGASSSRILTPDITSAFDSPSPLKTLMACVSGEFKYILMLYISGFCLFASTACLCLIAYRAALAGFSSIYILSGAYPLSIYLIHSVSSIIIIIFLCCICKISTDFSSANIGRKGPPSANDIAEYTVRCLFFAGTIFICILARHIILTLI